MVAGSSTQIFTSSSTHSPHLPSLLLLLSVSGFDARVDLLGCPVSPVPFVGDLAAVGTSHCSRSGCGCRSGLFRAALSCSQPPSHHPAPALLSTLDSAVLCRAFFCTIFLKPFWHVGMIYTQLLESCLFLHSNKLNKHIRAKNRPRKTFTAAFMSLSSSE